MIHPDFVMQLSSALGIEKTHLVERDVLLHQILTDLSRDKFFSEGFLFKGGTCLIKHYLGYFRFSDDADFTWRDQSMFEGRTAKGIRRELSRVIDTTGGILERISSARGLDFKCSKNDTEYVEFGGSNKMCTFKTWYRSTVLLKKFFIKIQVNFVEEMCTEPRAGLLKSPVAGNDEKLGRLFPEYLEYSNSIPFDIYDVREILSEKIRALITRRGVKARDFLDVFFIQRDLGIGPADVEECAIKKINHALGLYSKYRRNLDVKGRLAENGTMFESCPERDLLLRGIDEDEFQKFVKDLEGYLGGLIKKLAVP